MYNIEHHCDSECCRYKQYVAPTYPKNCIYCGGRGYTSNYDNLPPGIYHLVHVTSPCSCTYLKSYPNTYNPIGYTYISNTTNIKINS